MCEQQNPKDDLAVVNGEVGMVKRLLAKKADPFVELMKNKRLAPAGIGR